MTLHELGDVCRLHSEGAIENVRSLFVELAEPSCEPVQIHPLRIRVCGYQGGLFTLYMTNLFA